MGQAFSTLPRTASLTDDAARMAESVLQFSPATDAEALKLLVGTGQSLSGRLLMLDARNIYRKLGAVNRADAVRMVLEERSADKDGGTPRKQ